MNDSAAASAADSSLISVIAPCRNERNTLLTFCDSLAAQRLPAGHRLEVLIADGCSDDGTRPLLQQRCAEDRRFVCIDNPQRIVSTGLNRALAQARGALVVRMDLHTVYADDYLAECARALSDSCATCVGGAWQPVASTGRAGAIARAFSSRFGSGGAASRRLDFNGWVDTVYLGAWWRDELRRLGGFDETLVRNQDDELNLRIVRGGGRVWQSAAIRSWYTPRSSFTALFRQFWQYGYWKVPVIRKHRLPASPRQLAPFALVALCAVLAGGALWWPALWAWLGGVVALYAVAAMGSASIAARPWREPLVWCGVGWAYACMHFGYGLGFAAGLWNFLVVRRAPGVAATGLTR
ncbi:MAG: glycosyltransferase family 2 protein [Rubrivivax sp.]